MTAALDDRRTEALETHPTEPLVLAAKLDDRPIEALETHPTESLGPVATLEADEVAIPVRNETPVLPVDLLPFSRVAAVSSVRGRRRTGRTTILTTKPEKNAI